MADISLNKNKLDSLRYYIFSSKDIGDLEYLNVYNSSFNMWKEVWTAEFNKLNFPLDNLIDDFIRQDLIVVLANGEDVAAMHLYSFFSIHSLPSMSHRYMTNNYNDIFFEKLKKKGVNRVMSAEYVTVSPKWRKSKIGLSLGKVITNLMAKVVQNTNTDCAIAPARNDYKVSHMAYDIGGQPIFKNIVNHNVSCDLLACFSEKLYDHKEKEIAYYANKYWDERMLCTNNLWLDNKKNNIKSA